MRRSLVVPLVVTVAASLLTTPLAGSPAAADGAFALPLAGFSDILVDQTHGHVFISGGHDTSAIVVSDLAGAVQTSVANANGAAQMLLSQDGTKVYVGLTQADAVGVIDTTTLAMTTISTGTSTCPYDVAETAGRIWYSYGCPNLGDGAIGYISTSDNSVHPGVRTGTYNAVTLESSPNLPGEIVMASVGLSPGNISILTVTEGAGGAVTLPARNGVQRDARDVAITPDGSRIVAAAPYQHPVYLTEDMSADGLYPTDSGSTAVAIRPDGMVAAGIDWEPDIYVFKAGSRTLFRTYQFFGPNDPRLAPAGLAFGTILMYAIEESGGFPATYRLRVITPRSKSTLTVKTNASTYAYGSTAKTTVHLTTASPNQQVSLYAKAYGRAEKLIKTGIVDANGNLTASTPLARNTTFRASYAGDADFDPAYATTFVHVRARVTPSMKNYIGRSGKYYVYRVTQKATLVGTVAPNHAGDCLYVRALFYVRSSWGHKALTTCIHMAPASGGAGLLSGKGLAGIPIKMRAEWRGDSENAPRNSAWRYVMFVR